MTTQLIISIVVIWVLFSACLLGCLSMAASRFNRRDQQAEKPARASKGELTPQKLHKTLPLKVNRVGRP
jgi:hypothetical protein